MSPAKRSGIISDKALILEGLRDGRDAAIRVTSQAKISSDTYKAAQRVMKAIDDLAKDLTGEGDYFHLKMASVDGE